MRLRLLGLLSSLCVGLTSAFHVSGWYVGQNVTSFPLESIQWDVYTTIRCGTVEVNATTGAALPCSADPFFRTCLATARQYGKEVTLAPGDFGLEDCIYNQSIPSVKARCDKYISTVGDSVRSCKSARSGSLICSHLTTCGRGGENSSSLSLSLSLSLV